MEEALKFTPVLIVGAGFSGLTMAVQLLRKLQTPDFVIYERSQSLGGTWWNNSCESLETNSSSSPGLTIADPGCGVDIPFLLYSLSFTPNRRYSKWYPERNEILEYLYDVARRHKISSHVRTGISVDRASWQEATNTWLVHLRDISAGKRYRQECKLMLCAVGTLSEPRMDTVPGLKTFKGIVLHTADWKDDVVLEEKNVVVIGNGCRSPVAQLSWSFS